MKNVLSCLKYRNWGRINRGKTWKIPQMQKPWSFYSDHRIRDSLYLLLFLYRSHNAFFYNSLISSRPFLILKPSLTSILYFCYHFWIPTTQCRDWYKIGWRIKYKNCCLNSSFWFHTSHQSKKPIDFTSKIYPDSDHLLQSPFLLWTHFQW